MAIKYVSGKTRELRVGLSSYSEGKASLQVIGNVGVGTTNPLSVANPANTSVINAGIVTANKLFGDIVATGVGITNLNVTGISTFGGNVFVGTGATVGFGTTAFFNNDLRIESPLPKIYLTDTNHDSDWYISNSDGTIIFYDVTTTNSRFEINPGTSRPFIKTNFTTDSIFEGETTLGGHGASPSHSLTVAGVSTFNSSVGINSHLNVTGVSTFTDDVTVATSKIINVGTSNTVRLFNNGAIFRIQGQGNALLAIDTPSSLVVNSGATNAALFNPSSSTKLYFAGTERFETSGIGVSVYDALTVAGVSSFVGISTFNGNAEFQGSLTTFGGTGTGAGNGGAPFAMWAKANNYLWFSDDTRILMGFGQTLEMKSDGESIIRDTRAGVGGTLAIGADHLILRNKDGNEKYLEATDNGSVKLYHDFLPRFETTGIGITIAGIGSTAYIEGPENIIIDPHPYGVGTTSGNVFIRGDLYVEGTEFIVDVDKIELGDFQIGIATTAGTNVLLDGAGIGIGSTNIRKFITWNNATNALMTSENWNLASGKHYEIAGTDVLTSDTLLVGTGASVHSPSNNILTLHTSGAEKLRIDASGNLGIGTATPTDSANAANTSVTSAGIVTALEYYGVFKGSIPGFSTVFSSSSGQFSATPGTPQTIDTFAFATHDYQIAEYTLHFVHANGIQAQKALVMQNNSVAYSNEYGVMYDSELLVSIAATVSGGNVNITATPETGISGVTTFRWRREVQT